MTNVAQHHVSRHEADMKYLNQVSQRLAEVSWPKDFADQGVAAPNWNLKRRQQLWMDSLDSAEAATTFLQQVTACYAPIGLEAQFQALYKTLRPCLASGQALSPNDNQNAAAFLQGPRGSGKTLLLVRCLWAIHDENKLRQESKDRSTFFRLVHVNGLMIPGDDVSAVVREMLRQLSSDSLRHENPLLMDDDVHEDESDNDDDGPSKKRQRPSPARGQGRKQRQEQLTKLRHATFTNDMQLLKEILETAQIDSIPVLVVLDELDAFLGLTSPSTATTTASSKDSAMEPGSLLTTMISQDVKNRQLLLYTLLDRVATAGSYVALVGLTSRTGDLLERLEKRIRSRAEGTARFVTLGLPASFATLRSILLQKFQNEQDQDPESLAVNLPRTIETLWTFSQGADLKLPDEKQRQTLYEICLREYRLGRDVRWFCRVWNFALALYRLDYQDSLAPAPDDDEATRKHPPFTAQHLLDSLLALGASFVTDCAPQRDIITLPQDISLTSNDPRPYPVDLRLQALRDLSPPQVALMLASRRILVRDSARDKHVNELPPLTLDRIFEEYRTYRGNTNRYNTRLLWRAAQELMESHLIRPAADHSGAGPFEFQFGQGSSMNPMFLDRNTLRTVPLQLTLDIHRELSKALDMELLNCSVALREWGRKTN
jgi:Cdc6-like AAA superfamily ATPase